MNYAIYKYLETWITVIMDGVTNNIPSLVVQGVGKLLPIIIVPIAIVLLVALTALVHSILAYRNTRKILKKLEEMKK